MSKELTIEDVRKHEYLWKHHGQTVDGGQIRLEDALALPNAVVLMPKVMTNIVQEAMEPLLVGTSLLQRISYHYGQSITFGAFGALEAGDIPEGSEVPEVSLDRAGGVVTCNIMKSGIAVKIMDDLLRYSQFDVIGLHLRAAGRALARWKETKIFNYISGIGATIFDNANPTGTLKGVTTGRALNGDPNGSLTMDDLFDAFAHIMAQGFIPDTLLMHPLTWLMFVKDPVLRAFALQNGGGSFFNAWSGAVAQQTPWANAIQGGMAGTAGQNIVPGGNPAGLSATGIEGYNINTSTSAPVLPSYFGVPLRIIVSPYVRFDPRTLLTDIHIFDSKELGALVVDQDVTMSEWTDPRNDIKKVKLIERYGIAMFHHGEQIGVLRNIKLVPNEVVLPAQANIDVSGSNLAAISPTASISL